MTIGNGTVSCYYTKIGKTVHLRGAITWGSTTTFTGTFYMSLPVTAATQFSSNFFVIGRALQLDAGGPNYSSDVWSDGNDKFRPMAGLASGTYTQNSGLSNAAPMTWATGDTIAFTATYEAA